MCLKLHSSVGSWEMGMEMAGARVHFFWWLVENWSARSNNSSSCPCPTSRSILAMGRGGGGEGSSRERGSRGSKNPTAFPPRLRRPSFFFLRPPFWPALVPRKSTGVSTAASCNYAMRLLSLRRHLIVRLALVYKLYFLS